MEKTFDKNITASKKAVLLKFKRYKIKGEKTEDSPQVYYPLLYKKAKLQERFKDIIASDIYCDFFHQDSDNAIRDLVTARLWFYTIEADA